MDPSRLEGVVPTQALCAHCGYQFGGVAITDGRIRCPECGRDTDFVTPLYASGEMRASDRRGMPRWLTLIALLTIGAGLVAIPFFGPWFCVPLMMIGAMAVGYWAIPAKQKSTK